MRLLLFFIYNVVQLLFDLLCFIFIAVAASFRQYHYFCVDYFLNTVVTDDNVGVGVDSSLLLVYIFFFFGCVVLILNGGVDVYTVLLRK